MRRCIQRARLRRQGSGSIDCVWRSPSTSEVHMLSSDKLRRRILSNVTLAFCMLLSVSCTRPDGQAAAAGRAAAGPVEVVTAAARLQNRSVEIEAVGTALANESAQVTAKVANTVAAIRFREGSFVRRGDVLVELDD